MSQTDSKKEYLAPDYDDHPREEDVLEDCIEEVSEEEIRLEKLLEDQERLTEKLADEQDVFRDGSWEPMTSTTPFQTTQQPSSPGWGTSSSSSPKKSPWEKDEPKKWEVLKEICGFTTRDKVSRILLNISSIEYHVEES